MQHSANGKNIRIFTTNFFTSGAANSRPQQAVAFQVSILTICTLYSSAGRASLKCFCVFVCAHFSNGVASCVLAPGSPKNIRAFLLSRHRPSRLFYFALFSHPDLLRVIIAPPSPLRQKSKIIYLSGAPIDLRKMPG